MPLCKFSHTPCYKVMWITFHQVITSCIQSQTSLYRRNQPFELLFFIPYLVKIFAFVTEWELMGVRVPDRRRFRLLMSSAIVNFRMCGGEREKKGMLGIRTRGLKNGAVDSGHGTSKGRSLLQRTTTPRKRVLYTN